MLFNPGTIVSTPGAMELAAQGVHLWTYLQRHLNGNWGDIDEADKAENDYSLYSGFRLHSSYQTPCGVLWIITEADRSSTTFLTPDEY